MWLRRLRTALTGDSRRKILLWATIAGLICGAIEFGEPLENWWRTGRNTLRSHPASGDIVVVGIDDRSMTQMGRWPWPRRYHAQLADRLRELGARTVYFDIYFSAPSSPTDDRLLEQALARSKGNVVLPTMFAIDQASQRRTDLVPLPNLARHAQLANINIMRGVFGEVWKLPYAVKVSDVSYRSFAANLANTKGPDGSLFTLDYSIDVRSIPAVSAIDILQRRGRPADIRGKDVLIGVAGDGLGDTHILPGVGVMPGVYLHALGGETLRQGHPIELGWWIPFAFGWLLAATYLFATRRRLANSAIALGAVLLAAVPIALESRLIFVDFVPAALLLGIVAASQAWMRFRQRGAATNAVSGLPNLNALRLHQAEPGAALVVARIQNFAEIASTLPSEMERALVEQIAKRFTLGINGSTLYQGDEGIFAWFAGNEPGVAMGDQLEGLHAVFTSPVAVGALHVDLSIAFGVDRGSDRSLGNRIGSALVAAGEAAEEGLKWKAYDPAKLEDAEWKLSLLGRLDAAIDSGEIWVAYQPKLDIAANRIAGAEALARWSHPEKGDIPPQEFILAAEQHNRIEKLTLHVLNEAIRAAAAINAHGIDFDVAVNLSARLLELPRLADLVAERLAVHRLAPARLTLEVTESAAMGSGNRSMDMLKRLRALGVNISIDDYGTGFSTLEYLRDVPATEIKIDKGFVSSMDRSHGDRLMVNSTIQLAHSLGRKVVAEGVERAETLTALTAMRCDLAQGYFIGRPMKFVRLSRMILAERRRAAA